MILLNLVQNSNNFSKIWQLFIFFSFKFHYIGEIYFFVSASNSEATFHDLMHFFF